MAERKDAHDLIATVKDLALNLGRTPTRGEFESKITGGHYKLHKFGGFTTLLQAAGLDPGNGRAEKQKKNKFIYRPAKARPDIFSNYVNIDLHELFIQRGDPDFLRMIVWPDVHVEHRDLYAIACALQVTEAAKPDIFLDLGDFLNAGGLSHWPSDTPAEKRIVPECLRGRELLGDIRSAIGSKAEFWFLEGNHEDWIRQFLVSGSNPQLFDGLEKLGMEITLEKLLDFEKYRITHFELNKLVKIGSMAFTHGLYTGDNHPKQHLVKAKHTIYYGHTHDGKGYDDTSIYGPVRAQSLKCLCELNPTFLRGRLNNWSHGISEFIIFKDGSHLFNPIEIVNGRAFYQGRIFK